MARREEAPCAAVRCRPAVHRCIEQMCIHRPAIIRCPPFGVDGEIRQGQETAAGGSAPTISSAQYRRPLRGGAGPTTSPLGRSTAAQWWGRIKDPGTNRTSTGTRIPNRGRTANDSGSDACSTHGWLAPSHHQGPERRSRSPARAAPARAGPARAARLAQLGYAGPRRTDDRVRGGVAGRGGFGGLRRPTAVGPTVVRPTVVGPTVVRPRLSGPGRPAHGRGAHGCPAPVVRRTVVGPTVVPDAHRGSVRATAAALRARAVHRHAGNGCERA